MAAVAAIQIARRLAPSACGRRQQQRMGLPRPVALAGEVLFARPWTPIATTRAFAASAQSRAATPAKAPTPASPAEETQKVQGSKDDEGFEPVYENKRAGHIRLMAVFSVSQAVYWSVLCGDAYISPVLGVPTLFTPSPELLENITGSMQFFTDPGWILFGGLSSILCATLTRMFAHSVISRMAINDSTGQVKLRAHTVWGNIKAPQVFAIRDLGFDPPGTRDNYYMVEVPSRKFRMLLDTRGDFFDRQEAARPSSDAGVGRQMRAVLARLGVSHGGVEAILRHGGKSGSADVTSGPLQRRGEPPSIEEIRAARLKRQANK